MTNECPKCHSPLGAKATYCGCGWKKDIGGKGGGLPAIPGKSDGVSDCAWIANGERCHYPGTTSHNTVGMGPWYCRFHAMQDISQHYGEQVVRESRNYRQLTMKERDAMHLARVKDSTYKPKFRACEEYSCIKSGTLQPNGRYLCYSHKNTPDSIDYARPKRGAKKAEEYVSWREPGMDLEEVDPLDVASQA